ncbi:MULTISPECIES: restriction endonuclease subunit S [Campylobacter]|uniref:restriction endonuclease subunit S n=1 Tax=Campylobacter TaxID=194 RepID=UPI000A338560|nr:MULTISPECIES: restriction endonuclease subunit S [Campylobacter]
MNKIPKGWEKVKFEDVLKYEQPSKYIVKSTKYNNDYKTPVLTAGKGFILGYTNETDGIFKDTPVIIFDDFTTSSQYVNFHFKVKSSAMKILRPVDNVNLKFLFYKMQTIQHKSDTHKRYWISEYAKREIYIPNLLEQKAIVDKLDDSFAKIENAITNLINAKENLKLYKQSVLKSAFNGDLLPNTSPTHWEVKKLGEICEKIGDGLHGTPSYNDDGEYFFINGRNISYPYLIINNNVKRLSSDEALKYKKDFNTHTIFVSINGTLGNIGFYNNEKIILGKSVCYLNLKDNVNKYYIFFNLKSNEFLNYANLKATGSTIKNVSLQAMRNFEIPLPPLSEQNSIVAEIDRRFAIVDKTLNLIDKSIQNAKNLKQSILKKAFSGELRSEI